MKIIEVKIEISKIEGWNVDWNDEQAAADELFELDNEIERALARNCGINWSNVKAKSKLTER